MSAFCSPSSPPQFVFRAGGAGVVRRGLFTITATTTTIAGKKRGTWTRFSGSSSDSRLRLPAAGPCLLSRSAGSDEHYGGSSSNNKRRRTSAAQGSSSRWTRAAAGGVEKVWEKVFGRGVMVVQTPVAAGGSGVSGGGGGMAVEKWVKGEGVLRRILAVGEGEEEMRGDGEGEEEMRGDGEEEEEEEMVERENEELEVLREVLRAVLEMFRGDEKEEDDDDDDFVVPFCMAEWR